jgi:virulence-associated protein VapD
MSLWGIAYDLDVQAMKDAGYSRSDVANFYDAVRGSFDAHNFEKFHQLALYTSDKPHAVRDAYQVCHALNRIPEIDKFLRQLTLFQIRELNDLLPLIAQGKTSSMKDRIWQDMEAVFDEADATSWPGQ